MGTLRTLSHMPRLSTSFAAIRATADAQLGLITAAQLAEIGVHRSTTSRRSAGGMWTRVLPGVHLVGGGTPSRQQRLLAALLYAGDGSVLTGTTALRGYGFRALGLAEARDDDAERPEPVHVLVDHERRRLSTGFVRVERTRRDPGSVRVAGFPSAPVARAVGDAARRIPRERDVLKGVVAGKPNKVIAHELGISPRTVEVYRANVMTKMQAGSLSELVRLAMRAGALKG